MKLFTRYSRINLLATIIIFLFASVAFYLALHYLFLKQVDDDLKIEQHEIETYVGEHGELPEPVPVKNQKISYELVEQCPTTKFSTESPTLNNEAGAYRMILFCVQVHGKPHRVTVMKSLKGTNDLIGSILLITSITILSILLVALLINRILLKRLWKPFYNSLEIVRRFKVDESREMVFPANQVDEFTFMDQTLQNATRRARQDYLVLKEFTENASHEMQTPLAIIRSKLDLFLQKEDLSEDQSRTLQGAYVAVERLSKLNQSLLLLAKIGNNQFSSTSAVNLKQRLEEKAEAFHELWQGQNITVTTSLENATINMNQELADILLNNLLSNASRHNYPGGSIRIELTGKQLRIKNTSQHNNLDSPYLFSRFYKQDGKGNGLGLSIVKQICDVSGLTIAYSYQQGQHSFIFSF